MARVVNKTFISSFACKVILTLCGFGAGPSGGEFFMLRKLAMAAVATMAAAPAAHAVELDHVGLRAGTSGLGAELGVEIFPLVNARLIGNKFDLSYDTDLDGIDYDGDLKLQSFGVQVDIAIPGTFLYVSGGLYANQNEVDLEARPTGPVTVGDVTYTPAQVGTLRSNFTFEDIAPFVGVGLKFGAPKVEFAIEAGALFQGSPEATLTSNGALAADPTFRAELEKERRRIEDDLEEFEISPAVTASVRFKF
jgi:hypothetical protein